MGIIGNFMLGRHLTQVASIFEEVVSSGELPTEEDLNAESIFASLSLTRQAQVRYRMPGHLNAFRKFSPIVITQELVKNLLIANQSGRRRRVFAYQLALWYLVREGVAIDLERFEVLHGLGE